MNFKVKTDKFSLRITPDVVYKDAGADTGYRFFYLKYAYATFAPKKELQFTFGLQGNPWIGGYTNIWGDLGVIEKPHLDLLKMINGSADVGFAIHSGYKKEKERLFGMLDYWIGILNGEGYKKWDDGMLKDFAARVGIVPVDNDDMIAGGAVMYSLQFGDTYSSVNDRAHLISVLAHFHLKKFFHIQWEGFMKTQAIDADGDNEADDEKNRFMGMSILAIGHLIKDRLDLFFRFDGFKEALAGTDWSTYTLVNQFKAGVNIKIHPKYLWVLPNVVWAGAYNQDGFQAYTNELHFNVDFQAKFKF